MWSARPPGAAGPSASARLPVSLHPPHPYVLRARVTSFGSAPELRLWGASQTSSGDGKGGGRRQKRDHHTQNTRTVGRPLVRGMCLHAGAHYSLHQFTKTEQSSHFTDEETEDKDLAGGTALVGGAGTAPAGDLPLSPRTLCVCPWSPGYCSLLSLPFLPHYLSFSRTQPSSASLQGPCCHPTASRTQEKGLRKPGLHRPRRKFSQCPWWSSG